MPIEQLINPAVYRKKKSGTIGNTHFKSHPLPEHKYRKVKPKDTIQFQYKYGPQMMRISRIECLASISAFFLVKREKSQQERGSGTWCWSTDITQKIQIITYNIRLLNELITLYCAMYRAFSTCSGAAKWTVLPYYQNDHSLKFLIVRCMYSDHNYSNTFIGGDRPTFERHYILLFDPIRSEFSNVL